jgi:hypothetical protein
MPCSSSFLLCTRLHPKKRSKAREVSEFDGCFCLILLGLVTCLVGIGELTLFPLTCPLPAAHAVRYPLRSSSNLEQRIAFSFVQKRLPKMLESPLKGTGFEFEPAMTMWNMQCNRTQMQSMHSARSFTSLSFPWVRAQLLFERWVTHRHDPAGSCLCQAAFV